MKELLMKYKEIIMYLIFGTLTTVVNIVVYYVAADCLKINYLIANIAAWLGKCGNGHVTGMDYSKVSVAESQKLNAAAIKQGKCCVVQGDVSAIPFPDAVFDYVSAFETVYFWPGLKKCFFEVNRVLKNGGTFLICNESDGTNDADEKWTKLIDGMKIYTSDQLIAALKEAGFTEIKTYSNTKNHWISIVATK